jgi:hypothetical protein
MLRTITDAIEASAAGIVNEYGRYAPLIDYLYDRLDTMRTYSDKPGLKECSVLAGFSLAVAAAKDFARRNGKEEDACGSEE